jgi:hypothetical protein
MTKKSKAKYSIGDIHLITGKIKIAPNKWRNFNLNDFSDKEVLQLKKLKFEHSLNELKRGIIKNTDKDGKKFSEQRLRAIAANYTEDFIKRLKLQIPMFPSRSEVDMSRSSYPYELSDFLEDNPNFKKDTAKINKFIHRVKSDINNEVEPKSFQENVQSAIFKKLMSVVSDWGNKEMVISEDVLKTYIHNYLMMNYKKTIKDLSKNQISKLVDFYNDAKTKGRFKS